MELSTPAIRVLGTLMEKARTTPEVYPLTLNALVNACNQKTSRDPVTDYDDNEVLKALDELRDKGLAMRVDMAGSRTAKFRENATAAWQLKREEYALLAVLMLRGAQTPGQLRQRCDRLYPFAELQQVGTWLNNLQQRDEEPTCMVQALPHLPGTKEIRWIHLLGDKQDAQPEASHQQSTISPAGLAGAGPAEAPPEPPSSEVTTELLERMNRLEGRVQELETLFNEYLS